MERMRLHEKTEKKNWGSCLLKREGVAQCSGNEVRDSQGQSMIVLIYSPCWGVWILV